MFFKYSNLKNLIKIYKLAKKRHYLKKNIQQFFKNKYDRVDTIKVAYDTQSGDYIKYFEKLSNKTIKKIYFPIIETIQDNFKTSKTILDFGCGELTTSYYIFNNLKKKIFKYYANDNSLNRLIVGRNYLKRKFDKNNYKKFELFCNSQYKLPFKDNSIDLVLTIHSLEPNNKIKKKIIKELFRVSRHGMILMEPHYEISSIKQKKRMNKYGYIKGIGKTFKDLGLNHKIIKKKYHINKDNISSLFIVFKKKNAKKNKVSYVDPLDLSKLINYGEYLYSKNNFRIFPIIDKIKIFNNDTQLFLPSIKSK